MWRSEQRRPRRQGSCSTVLERTLCERDAAFEAAQAIRESFAQPGETRQVSFELTSDDLSFIGADSKRIVEPGSLT